MMYRETLAVVMAALLAACGAKTESRDVLAVETERVAVCATTMGRSYVGEVEAYTSTSVSFTGLGTVLRVYVEEGQAVSQGQKLAELDATQARNNLAAATAMLDQAEDAYARMKVLHDAAALSDMDWVNVQSTLHQAEAQMAQAQKAVNDCDLYAPRAGVIGKNPMKSGVTALPAEPVCNILDISRVKIRVSIPEKEIGAVASSTPSVVTIASLGGRKYAGERIEKGVEADASTRTYSIKITVSNDDRQLLPGMVAEVTLATNTADTAAITVPVRCVQSAGGRQFVWTAVKGKAHRTDVTLGRVTGDRIAILSGLAEGDKVIVSGYQKVSEEREIKEIIR